MHSSISSTQHWAVAVPSASAGKVSAAYQNNTEADQGLLLCLESPPTSQGLYGTLAQRLDYLQIKVYNESRKTSYIVTIAMTPQQDIAAVCDAALASVNFMMLLAHRLKGNTKMSGASGCQDPAAAPYHSNAMRHKHAERRHNISPQSWHMAAHAFDFTEIA